MTGDWRRQVAGLQTCPHPIADAAKEADIIALGIDAAAGTGSVETGQMALEGRGIGRFKIATPNTNRKGTYGEHSSKKALSGPSARF